MPSRRWGYPPAFPIARRWVPGLEQGLSIGATLKQSWGHVLAFGEDAGTLAQSNPLELDVDFPVVHPDTERQDWNRGSGLGLDVGVAWERGPWAAAAVIQNLFHTFEWDLEKLVYRPGQAVFDEDTNEVGLRRTPGDGGALIPPGQGEGPHLQSGPGPRGRV